MKKIKLLNLKKLINKEIGISAWTQISQKQINSFAECTDDYQFIHLDEIRAKKDSPFGGTIAHGFLTLSLLSKFAFEVGFEIEDAGISINYGFDKVRFIKPVMAGKKIRARFELLEIAQRNRNQILITYKVKVEIEGEDKPALLAHWLTMQVIK